jgi:hypothetical protein
MVLLKHTEEKLVDVFSPPSRIVHMSALASAFFQAAVWPCNIFHFPLRRAPLTVIHVAAIIRRQNYLRRAPDPGTTVVSPHVAVACRSSSTSVLADFAPDVKTAHWLTPSNGTGSREGLTQGPARSVSPPRISVHPTQRLLRMAVTALTADLLQTQPGDTGSDGGVPAPELRINTINAHAHAHAHASNVHAGRWTVLLFQICNVCAEPPAQGGGSE